MNNKLSWTLRLIPAVILAQTLPFKFSGHPESVALFTDLATATLGNPSLEGIFRIGTGLVELLAIVLLLIPKQALNGALLVVATMSGALASHALFLRFEGYVPLAAMALLALVSSATYLFFHRIALLKLIGSLKKRSYPLK